MDIMFNKMVIVSKGFVLPNSKAPIRYLRKCGKEIFFSGGFGRSSCVSSVTPKQISRQPVTNSLFFQQVCWFAESAYRLMIEAGGDKGMYDTYLVPLVVSAPLFIIYFFIYR